MESITLLAQTAANAGVVTFWKYHLQTMWMIQVFYELFIPFYITKINLKLRNLMFGVQLMAVPGMEKECYYLPW